MRIDAGSYAPVVATDTAAAPRMLMSNALLIGAKHSSSGHPIFVAGPQVGYFSPEILMEEDLHGGGLDARGVSFPGLGFYLQIGRGPDYAWSATSASSDVVDQFAETLCGGDSVHYLYKGTCTAMGTFDAGTLKGQNGSPDTELTYRTTVHGPVVAYATSNGTKVALSLARSTRGSRAARRDSVPDDVDGRRPLAPGVHQDDVRVRADVQLVLRRLEAHRDVLERASAAARPGRRSGSADERRRVIRVARLARADVASARRRSVERIDRQLEQQARRGIRRRGRQLLLRIGAPGAAPDRGARETQGATAADRRRRDEPRRDGGSALDAHPIAGRRDVARGRTERARPRPPRLLGEWDGNRLDSNLDGSIDQTGAAIMDAWWPKLAVAVLQTQLGPLTDDLKALAPISNDANSGGSSYGSGWYSYVDEAVRAALGSSGAGHTALTAATARRRRAQAVLWQSLDQAGNELAAAQGSNPSTWRADATSERIHFAGFLADTMRWTNRPTFQQVSSSAACWFARSVTGSRRRA